MVNCAPSRTLLTASSSDSISWKVFAAKPNKLLRGVVGCTYLTELCAVLPTAAIQAFADEVWSTENGSPFDTNAEQPLFQLGRCHALRFDGPAVREHYPRWADYTPRNLRDQLDK